MPPAVGCSLAGHEIVTGKLVVQFRTRVGVSNGDLDRFGIQFFRKIERSFYGFTCFAGSPMMKSP